MGEYINVATYICEKSKSGRRIIKREKDNEKCTCASRMLACPRESRFQQLGPFSSTRWYRIVLKGRDPTFQRGCQLVRMPNLWLLKVIYPLAEDVTSVLKGGKEIHEIHQDWYSTPTQTKVNL